MTIGSLFSGVGGLERGLELLGLGPVVWQCERDPYAYSVLEHHWPRATRYRDVRRIDGQVERVDIICGGFPCQDVSVAGKGAGLDGARSGLWSEFARVVRLLRPRVVFVENVAALRGRGLDRVLADLAALGFDAEWGCFRALDVGAPHIRERIFVLAYANGGGCGVERSAQPRRFEGPSWGESDRRGADGSVHRFPPGPDRIAEWEGASPALSRAESLLRGGSHGLARRVDRLRCLGNAVVPQVSALAWETLTARIGV